MQSKSGFANSRRSVSLIIGKLNQQNSEFAQNMKCSLVQRISGRHNVSFVGFMQYLNFGRKYDAAAVIVDLSRLPNETSLFQQAKIIMIRLRVKRITVHLFGLRRKVHGNFGREIFNIARKIRKIDTLEGKGPTVFNQQEF
ncbi:hypothetical protein AVEN_85664-1 [Araneus ventricosus]|uniref:Uncharacterized protein n=1 Tax=Araneus ventricosus TaxID=182803 RepID=A0A4Y2Q1S8_ARAVE|nr:hypothetical protein AVEN_85664-1 [Araneus ventricosus]